MNYMLNSDGLWEAIVVFPPNTTSFEYKYLIAHDLTAKWEDGPNRKFSTVSNIGGVVELRDQWRSASNSCINFSLPQQTNIKEGNSKVVGTCE